MNLFIKKFPDDLHRKIKSAAGLQGVTLCSLIIKSLTDKFMDGRREADEHRSGSPAGITDRTETEK